MSDRPPLKITLPSADIIPFPRAPVRPVAPLPEPTLTHQTDLDIYNHIKKLSINAHNLHYLITMGAMSPAPGAPLQFFTWIYPRIGVSELATSATLFQMEVTNILLPKKK